MIPNMNLSNARSETINADGYIMRVMDATIDMKYNRLQLKMDITEGDHAGYYKRLEERAGFWGMTVNLYLDPKQAWKFARTIDAFRESNADFEWNDDGENDEHKLVGMYVGVVTRWKEYIGNDGLVKKKLVPYITVPVNQIREGKYEVPPTIRLENAPTAPQQVEVIDRSEDTPMGFNETDNDVPF